MDQLMDTSILIVRGIKLFRYIFIEVVSLIAFPVIILIVYNKKLQVSETDQALSDSSGNSDITRANIYSICYDDYLFIFALIIINKLTNFFLRKRHTVRTHTRSFEFGGQERKKKCAVSESRTDVEKNEGKFGVCIGETPWRPRCQTGTFPTCLTCTR